MIPTDHHLPYLEFHAFEGTTVQAIRPRVPGNFGPDDTTRALAGLLDQLLVLTPQRAPGAVVLHAADVAVRASCRCQRDRL